MNSRRRKRIQTTRTADIVDRAALIKEARELGMTQLVAGWKTETIIRKIKEKKNEA